MSSTMRKLASIKGVIENIRQSVNTPSPPGTSGVPGPVKLEEEVLETLIPDQFTAETSLRHGFPYKPVSVAFDPIQNLLAIGTREGSVCIFGKPGIDVELRHEDDPAVMQIHFLLNEGRLLTACTNDTLNLWDFRKKTPELVHSLQLSKERLVLMYTEFQDKWLYVGTERGNVLILNLETFTLSGYVIAWNKMIDPMQKNHPGSVCHISVNPEDQSKLLIGFVSGLVCLWDLATKKGEQRYTYNQTLYSISWHISGKQFICSYGDGSLVTWNIKPQYNKPQSVQFPHGKKNKETNKMEPCEKIQKVLWCVDKVNNESYYVFSGGLPLDVTGETPSITVMQGKSTTLLEMEYCVLDFLLVTDSPYPNSYQNPKAIIVMLGSDLVAIDYKAPNFPCFQNPYAMDFNESPVTCIRYLVDCPGDMIVALYQAGAQAKKEGTRKDFSQGDWPVNGGTDCGTESCSYSELVVTGHADGSVRFWDSSSTSMQALYRIKTAKYFEKVKKGLDCLEENPYAICQIDVCTKTRDLALAGVSGQVMYFKFKPKDASSEIKFMEIPIVYDVSSNGQTQAQAGSKNPDSSPPVAQHFEFPNQTPRPRLNVASQSASYSEPEGFGFNFDQPQYEYFCPLRLRSHAPRKNQGYHAELICLTPWVNNEAPTTISCIALSSSYGLLTYGNGSGLVLVDIKQNVCLLNMGTSDLYGGADPFQRMPRSPKPLESSASLDIVRVDLSSYSQVAAGSDTDNTVINTNATPTSAGTPTPKDNAATAVKDSINVPQARGIERVKSPDCRRLQKAGSSAEDSSMSKSQSSSINSLDQMVSSEGVTSAFFVDSFPEKNDFHVSPCLFVGTTLGSLVAISINLQTSEKQDSQEERVVVHPSGTSLRLRGSVLATCFIDTSAAYIKGVDGNPPENVHVTSRAKDASPTSAVAAATLTAQSSQEGDKATPHTNPSGDQQIAVVCTEKSAAVFALPSQRQMYSQTINESSSVVCADIINFGGSKYTPCLVACTADGYIKAYSLPSLRPMLDMYFVAATDLMKQTMTFSNYGHGIYLCNKTEVQKFSISADFMRQLPDMQGSVYQDNLALPPPPSKGLIKNFFSSPKPLDREELFGETAGKIGAGMAKTLAGSGMQGAQAKGAGAASEAGKAKMAFVERGEKLNQLEDKTEAMALEAKQYATNAHNLMLSAKNKKWYQI